MARKRIKSGQLELFPSDIDTATGTVEDRISHNHVHVRQSTFLAGLSTHVHRWFRLTPSFGPDLVRKMLGDMETEPDHVILDPYSGAGTMVIESKLDGLRSVGFEINPLLHFVCETCTRWDMDPAMAADCFTAIGERFKSEQARLDGKDVEQIGIPLPTIFNVFRWWRRDVLKDLLILREAIDHSCTEPAIRAFFRLALAGVLVPDLTNVTLGRLQLHFIDREKHDLRVWKSYEAHAKSMLDDLRKIPDDRRNVPSKIYHLDTTTEAVTKVNERIDRVVTSPPYPNRYSYVWNTRPHLYMLQLFTKRNEGSDLDVKTVGGTWGTATSRLQKGIIEPAFPVVAEIVVPVAEVIRKDDNLMANYLVEYFNGITRQIVVMEKILAPSVKCAYVIGNSRLKGVYVEADVILGKIFEGLNLGFKTDRIERIRKRHSDHDLHESIIYASR